MFARVKVYNFHVLIGLVCIDQYEYSEISISYPQINMHFLLINLLLLQPVQTFHTSKCRAIYMALLLLKGGNFHVFHYFAAK